MTDRPVMDNPRADRVRAVAALATRQARRRTGTFLVEGPQSCREALRAHLGEGPSRAAQDWPAGRVLTQVFTAPWLGERDPELAELVRRVSHGDGAPLVREATDEVLTALSDAVTTQGIVAVARVPESVSAGADAPWPGQPRLVGVLCRVQDPGNAGTILRAADAAGADLLVATAGSTDLFAPKAVRSTAGSLFHVPVRVGASVTGAAAAARAAGLQVWAADGRGADRLDTLPATTTAAPTAWLFGNEAQGLDAGETGAADRRVAVPLYGAAESLNVATAATVCLYASAMAASQTRSG